MPLHESDRSHPADPGPDAFDCSKDLAPTRASCRHLPPEGLRWRDEGGSQARKVQTFYAMLPDTARTLSKHAFLLKYRQNTEEELKISRSTAGGAQLNIRMS